VSPVLPASINRVSVIPSLPEQAGGARKLPCEVSTAGETWRLKGNKEASHTDPTARRNGHT